MNQNGNPSGTEVSRAPRPWALGRFGTALTRLWTKTGPGWTKVLGASALFLLVWICYQPQLPGNFIWDDRLVLKGLNPLLTGELTPWSIWFQTDFVLANFAFWGEWLVWGDHPLGYHIVNLLLHSLSACLLWRLLARLSVPGAWFAAAVFAVHPVCVNTVARIAELKNTLSLTLVLLSFLLYLRSESGMNAAVQPAGPGRLRWPGAEFGWYALALLAFVLALFSKTTILTLPVFLLLSAYWQRGRLVPEDGFRTVPFFILALGFGLMSSWFQKHQALAGETLPPVSWEDRFAVAGHDVWFYIGKDFWPSGLSVVYPWWHPAEAVASAWLPLLGVGLLLVTGWHYRRTWGRHLLFGFGCFTVALFPALGFIDAQFQTWFQVSDHLQYLPLIAVVALASSVLAARLPRAWFSPVAGVILATLVVLSSQQARVFATDETLWQDTVAKNPQAWMAHNNLGVILARQGHLPAAREQFEASLAAKPGNVAAQVDLGHLLALQGDLGGARELLQAALRNKLANVDAHENLAQVLAQLGDLRAAKTHFQAALQCEPKLNTRLQLASLLFQTGDYANCAWQYRQTISGEPDLVEPLNNLAWLLATCPEDGVRNGLEAVRCAEKACALTHYQHPGALGTLAAAYAEAGRFAEAVKTCRQAIDLSESAGNASFSAINSQLLRLYQMGRPYHAPPAPNRTAS